MKQTATDIEIESLQQAIEATAPCGELTLELQRILTGYELRPAGDTEDVTASASESTVQNTQDCPEGSGHRGQVGLFMPERASLELCGSDSESVAASRSRCEYRSYVTLGKV